MKLTRPAARRLCAAAAVTCAALAVPAIALAAPGDGATSAATQSPTTHSVAAPKCGAKQLTAWIGLPAEGEAGTFRYQLELTNISSRICTLQGFPGVSARDAHGQVGRAAVRNHEHPADLITVKSGGTAHIELGITDVSVFPGATCKPVTATSLRVYPPNDTNSLSVPFSFRACSGTGAKYLDVSPSLGGVGIPLRSH